MPNIKSAKKRVLIIKRQTAKNASFKSAVKTAIRKFEEIAIGKAEGEIKTSFVNAVSSLDKAAAKGIIHKNAVARRKSRLAKMLNSAAAK